MGQSFIQIWSQNQPKFCFGYAYIQKDNWHSFFSPNSYTCNLSSFWFWFMFRPSTSITFWWNSNGINIWQDYCYILFLIQDVIKHYSVRKFMNQNKKHFKNVCEIPFLDKHSITVGNGQQIFTHKMIALCYKYMIASKM